MTFNDNNPTKWKKIKIQSCSLSGSTLLETIVASVILMIIFTLAMDTLTRLMVLDNEDADYLRMETDIDRCRREICKNDLVPGERTYEYDWGKIEVDISSYKEEIYQIEMIAITNKQHRQIRFRYLNANE